MPTDEQLAQKCKAGDEAALAELIGRYAKPVYNFVYRYVGNDGDAEDITQDAFVSAWKHMQTFDDGRKFKTWMFAIAKNASLNWIKKKKPELFSFYENEDGENLITDSLADTAPLPDELFHRADLSRKIFFAMAKLNRNYRDVLSLYYRDNFNFREIAECSGDSIHTVKSRHRRALIALKKLLTR